MFLLCKPLTYDIPGTVSENKPITNNCPSSARNFSLRMPSTCLSRASAERPYVFIKEKDLLSYKKRNKSWLD